MKSRLNHSELIVERLFYFNLEGGAVPIQLSRLGVKDDAIPAGGFGVVKSFIGTSNYFLRVDCFRSIQATPKLEVTRMDWVR